MPYRFKYLGRGGGDVVVDVVTLASGSATFAHGLNRAHIQVTPVDASAIPGETFGVVGTVLDNGMIAGPSATIKSSNGSSTKKVLVRAEGY